MELAILMVMGMIGTAPLAGYWKARTWAERNGLRLRGTRKPLAGMVGESDAA